MGRHIAGLVGGILAGLVVSGIMFGLAWLASALTGAPAMFGLAALVNLALLMPVVPSASEGPGAIGKVFRLAVFGLFVGVGRFAFGIESATGVAVVAGALGVLVGLAWATETRSGWALLSGLMLTVIAGLATFPDNAVLAWAFPLIGPYFPADGAVSYGAVLALVVSCAGITGLLRPPVPTRTRSDDSSAPAGYPAGTVATSEAAKLTRLRSLVHER